MKAHVLTGSKGEIAETLGRIDGVICEVIVFVEEPSDSFSASSEENILAAMEPFAVRVGDVDDSRESLYTRLEGE
jgi:hypothetical protein